MNRSGWLSVCGIVVGILGCGGSIFGFIRAQDLAGKSGMIDFYQFWLVGQFVDQPGYLNIYSEPVYDRIGSSGVEFARESNSPRLKAAADMNAQLYAHKIEPISTPALYATFKLFSSGDFDTDANRYQLICTLAFIAGLVAFVRAVRFNWPATAAIVALTLNWFGPFKVDILDGNTARLQFGILGAAIAALAFLPARPGRFVAGLALAMGIVFKPNLVLSVAALLALYAGFRRWRALLELAIGLFAGAVVAVLASSLYLHSFALWPQWLDTIVRASASQSAVYSIQNENCSFARLLSAFVGFNVSWPLLIICAGILVWQNMRRQNKDVAHLHSAEVLALGAGASVMLISSPIVWPSYFLFMLPTMLHLSRPAHLNVRSVVRWTCAATTFVCVATSGQPWLSVSLPHLVYLLGTLLVLMLMVD